MPGTISIFLSIVSIPIFLNYLDPDIYANYLVQHFILSIGMFLNLNFGKVAAIKIQKIKISSAKKYIYSVFIFSFGSGLILSGLIYGLLFLFFSEKNFFDINFSLYIGLLITIIYVTAENITKSLGLFKYSSLANFFFYSVSISFPALLIIYNNDLFTGSNMFNISLFFKLISLIFLLTTLHLKGMLIRHKKMTNIMEGFYKYGKWMTFSGIYNQVFDYLDKYLIKIYLGASSMITYSVPQLMAAKLTLLSQAIISVILPRLSKKDLSHNKKLQILTANIYLFLYLVGLMLIALIPLIEIILELWLKDSYNIVSANLFKIFILLTFISCISNILVCFYEANLIPKKNTRIETIMLVPFLFGLLISIYFKSIYAFAFVILIKEAILLLIRVNFYKIFLWKYKILLFQITNFISVYLFSLFNMNEGTYFFIFIFILVMIFNFPSKIIKKEFY